MMKLYKMISTLMSQRKSEVSAPVLGSACFQGEIRHREKSTSPPATNEVTSIDIQPTELLPKDFEQGGYALSTFNRLQVGVKNCLSRATRVMSSSVSDVQPAPEFSLF